MRPPASVAKTGETLVVEDASSDPRLTRLVARQEGILAMLVVPLKTQEKVVGTLSVAGRLCRKFRDEEVELLVATADGEAVTETREFQPSRSLRSIGESRDSHAVKAAEMFAQGEPGISCGQAREMSRAVSSAQIDQLHSTVALSEGGTARSSFRSAIVRETGP